MWISSSLQGQNSEVHLTLNTYAAGFLEAFQNSGTNRPRGLENFRVWNERFMAVLNIAKIEGRKRRVRIHMSGRKAGISTMP